MKSLKELYASCVLISKFSQSAFVVSGGHEANFYKRSNTCYLFYDNHDTYYLYTYICFPQVSVYSSLNAAVDGYCSFVQICLL